LISGIAIGLIAIISGLVSEEVSGIFIGLIVIAVMVFCAYGKNIVITRKNGDKVNPFLHQPFEKEKHLEQVLN
jgi:hypothetical protein